MAKGTWVCMEKCSVGSVEDVALIGGCMRVSVACISERVLSYGHRLKQTEYG